MALYRTITLLAFKVLCFGVLPALASANQALIDQIHRVEVEYGLPHGYLVTIAEIETSFDPLAINMDGVPFYFSSRGNLLSGVKSIVRNPYLISVRQGGETTHFFRKTQMSARELSSQLLEQGLELVVRDGRYWKRLNTNSTDFCVLQINYKVHAGSDFHTVDDILDLDRCLEFGARYLATMIDRHGFEMGTGCYHYCKPSSSYYQRYVARFQRAYHRRYGVHPFTQVAISDQ